MTETFDASDIVKKKLMPDDLEFLAQWTKYNSRALTELATHFCRFPGDVEVLLALKMRHTGGEFTFTFDAIASLAEGN